MTRCVIITNRSRSTASRSCSENWTPLLDPRRSTPSCHGVHSFGSQAKFKDCITLCTWRAETLVKSTLSSSYSDGAEEDVKRYERSYKQLPPAHKMTKGCLVNQLVMVNQDNI